MDRGRRVLIVEDNATNLQLATFLLEVAGFVVDAASSASEGLAKARATVPHVILMDVELPEVDGLTATRQLKDDPSTAAIPVVALTANAMRGDRERCLDAGCSGYIAKPIDTKQFARIVASFVVDT